LKRKDNSQYRSGNPGKDANPKGHMMTMLIWASFILGGVAGLVVLLFLFGAWGLNLALKRRVLEDDDGKY
jgi:hypothetical protein